MGLNQVKRVLHDIGYISFLNFQTGININMGTFQTLYVSKMLFPLQLLKI